jgi:two-component system, NtrC family, response regulator GlrR
MDSGVTRGRSQPVRVRYAKVRVEVTRGREPDVGRRAETAEVPLTIGTALDNDLPLSDDSVSRRHCQLEPTPGGLRLRDLGSTNGVFVAGLRVRDAILPERARVQVGDTELTVTTLNETVVREQVTTDRFGDVLGRSARMRELFADLERVAATDMTLVLEGETGTGKDLIAESVHAASPRADRPFVVFDCGAVTPSLIESELFGTAKEGVFELADGGTLFLDELGELPRDLQPKLLRVLEKRQVKRVGGTRTLTIDVRIIAATNRSLRAEVARGAFREDLYYRLAAAKLLVPPLRERLEDVPLLVELFLSQLRPPRSPDSVPAEVWEMFRSHHWPGNVRELRNAVQRLGLAMQPDRLLHETTAGGATAGRTDRGQPEEPLGPLRIARREAMDRFEREYVGAALRRGGSVSRAAGLAEVSRQMMHKLARKHGLG